MGLYIIVEFKIASFGGITAGTQVENAEMPTYLLGGS